LHLREAPSADQGAVEALVRKIEAERLANGGSLTLCRDSDEPFTTNDVIFRRRSEIPSHPPTAGLAGAVLATIAGTTWSAGAQAEPEAEAATRRRLAFLPVRGLKEPPGAAA
jgi:hypothetical protein